MFADAIRHFYEYHFSENRKLWDQYIAELSDEQFLQGSDYSHGSIRDQIVHLIQVDGWWFSDLGAPAFPEQAGLADSASLANIRVYWDAVESSMRAYLSGLQDEMMATKPLSGEDENLRLWQVLLHVVNHGTDHRAQILRQLNDLGVQTLWQDYIFFTYGNLT